MISTVKRTACESGRSGILSITTGNERRHRRPEMLDDELIIPLRGTDAEYGR